MSEYRAAGQPNIVNNLVSNPGDFIDSDTGTGFLKFWKQNLITHEEDKCFSRDDDEAHTEHARNIEAIEEEVHKEFTEAVDNVKNNITNKQV